MSSCNGTIWINGIVVVVVGIGFCLSALVLSITHSKYKIELQDEIRRVRGKKIIF